MTTLIVALDPSQDKPALTEITASEISHATIEAPAPPAPQPPMQRTTLPLVAAPRRLSGIGPSLSDRRH